MYLKLQIAKKSKPLASLGRWDSDSRFSLWKTIHLLRHFACEGNRFLLSARSLARSLLSDPSAWRRWFKSLFNAVRSIFALHMLCERGSVYMCGFVCVCEWVWIQGYLSKEKHPCVLLQDKMFSCKPQIPPRLMCRGDVTSWHQSPSHVSNPSHQEVEGVVEQLQTAFQHLWASHLVWVDGKQNFWWKAGPSPAVSAEVTLTGCFLSLTAFSNSDGKTEGYKKW